MYHEDDSYLEEEHESLSPFEICPEYEEFVCKVSDMITDCFHILDDKDYSERAKVRIMKEFLDMWANDEL